jgi:hypothetical protein
MLISKIIRHFSRLKLSVDKFYNFAFRWSSSAVKIRKILTKPGIINKKAALRGF